MSSNPPKSTLFVPLAEELKGIVDILTNEFDAVPTRTIAENPETILFDMPDESRRNVQIQLFAMDPNDRQAMGNVVASARVATALASLRPNNIFLVGLAGSLDPEQVKLGDVVVTNRAKYLQIDKVQTFDAASMCFSGEDGDGKYRLDRRKRICENSVFRMRRDLVRHLVSEPFLQSYSPYVARHPLENLEKVAQSGREPILNFGDVLGSDWVIDSEEFVSFAKLRDASSDEDWYTQSDIKDSHGVTGAAAVSFRFEGRVRNRWDKKTSIVAADMESYGFFKSLELFNFLGYTAPFALTVRGISDTCVNKGALDKSTRGAIRAIAVRNALRVSLDLIREMYKMEASSQRR